MSENTDGYIVCVRHVRISADAGRNGSPYMNGGVTYVRFDADAPGGISPASAKRADETVFESGEEADTAVQALLARNAAKARTDAARPRTPRPAIPRDQRPPKPRVEPLGLATQLVPTTVGGQSYGGYEILPRTQLLAERAEERRLAEDKVRAELALETTKVTAQQAVVDRIAAELKDAKAIPTPDGGVLRHDLPRGIQQETRADGTSRFRARKTVRGQTLPGPWVPSIEEAISGWSEKYGRDWGPTSPHSLRHRPG